jgi:HPt (histidine-containing phosphotransfer) domain-containing protein
MADIMDPAKIEEFRGYSEGTDDFIKELFEQYYETSDNLIQQIQAAHDSGDQKKLLSDIHTLKGSTRNMGLLKLGEFIVNWEKQMKEGDFSGFDDKIQELKSLYQEVRDFQQQNFPLA